MQGLLLPMCLSVVRGTQPLHRHPRIYCPKCIPPTSALHPPLFCPHTFAMAGTPLLPLCHSLQQCSWCQSLKFCSKKTSLEEKTNKQNPKHLFHDSRGNDTLACSLPGLVLGLPLPTLFSPPCSAPTSPSSSPPMLGCDDKSVFAVVLKKNVSPARRHPSPLVPPG